MTYKSLIEELAEYAEPNFARFQERLIFTSAKIMGVRTPILRKLAKKYSLQFQALMEFPNEYYEVVFIKLCVVASLPYERFLEYLNECVSILDNWATCDTFKAKCIQKNRDNFLVKLEEIFDRGGEFYERFVLVTLLSYYVEEKYSDFLKSYIGRANTEKYYVHMAVAWLVAEILIKLPSLGEEILNSGVLSVKTHNKAIQKATESFRISPKDKQRLKLMKIITTT